MKTVKMLCEHLGEISYTSTTPIGVVLSQQGDTVIAERQGGNVITVNLKEETTALISSDNWGIVSVKRWELHDYEIPNWATWQMWLAHIVAFKYFFGFGGKEEWGEKWFRKLSKFGESQKFAAIKLLNTQKFRSSFRQSLHDQLEAWLNDDNPKYDSPFSPRQWEALIDVYTARAAKQRSNALYWNRTF